MVLYFISFASATVMIHCSQRPDPLPPTQEEETAIMVQLCLSVTMVLNSVAPVLHFQITILSFFFYTAAALIKFITDCIQLQSIYSLYITIYIIQVSHTKCSIYLNMLSSELFCQQFSERDLSSAVQRILGQNSQIYLRSKYSACFRCTVYY